MLNGRNEPIGCLREKGIQGEKRRKGGCRYQWENRKLNKERRKGGTLGVELKRKIKGELGILGEEGGMN